MTFDLYTIRWKQRRNEFATQTDCNGTRIRVSLFPAYAVVLVVIDIDDRVKVCVA